ncbi:hypothetical protein V6N11_029057 [Hibiscus sabdariffa]|uniref:RNase H type-1 domain-containing protein n=2 Tax=Hibiscus sabdariffa TaxID=183260 RepID=A0ABR2NWE5_9ROSI
MVDFSLENAPSRHGAALANADSGRPPDGSPHVLVPTPLERPGSPLADTREQKKVKNSKGSIVENPLWEDMETMSHVEHQPTPKTHVGIHGSTNHDATETDTTQPGMVNKSGTKSYANSVMGNTGKQKQSTTTNYLDNVVVHDEDCIVERDGSFPIVRFSERVHDQIDQCMRNVLVLCLLGRNIGFKTLLSRIQMLWKPVGTRRRKLRVANDSTRSVNVQAPIAGGSRFGVLETVEDDQEPMVDVALPKRNSLTQQGKVSITTSTSEAVGPAHPIRHNPAYLASNPEKRSKTMKTKASGVTVVPMVAGQPTKVFSHKSGSSKTHAAVSIVEKGHGASARPGIRVNKQHVAVTKQTKATHPSLGLRGNNVNPGSQVQPAIQEWVQHVCNKIVEICNQVGSTGTKQRLLTLENENMLVSNSDSGADDEDMTVSVEDDTEALHERALVQGHGRLLILAHIEELLRQNWLVEFRSIHREGNSIADTLAKLVCLGDLNYTWFVEPPAAVRHLLQKEFPYGNTTNT